MKRADSAIAIIMMLLSGLVMYDTSGLGYWEEFGPGPAFAPFLLALLAIAFSLALLVETFRGDGGEPLDWPDAAGRRRIAAAIGLLILFVAALPWLGFLITGACFMLLLLLPVLRRPLVPSLATAALTIAIIQGIFVSWLGVKLPTGPFGF